MICYNYLINISISREKVSHIFSDFLCRFKYFESVRLHIVQIECWRFQIFWSTPLII